MDTELHSLSQKLDNTPFKVVYVPDAISKPFPRPGDRLIEDLEFSPLTSDVLSELDLFHSRDKIGWLCGDYVAISQLDRDWDHVWIVEPDVVFLNGAESIFEEFSDRKEDLLGVKLTKPSESWAGSDRIKALCSPVEVYTMTFPLVRMSRRLVTYVHEFRRSFNDPLEQNSDLRVPNDEVVVATAVERLGGLKADLAVERPELFSHWNTTLRYDRESLSDVFSEPKVVHSAVSRERFINNVRFQWERLLRGETTFEKSLRTSLEAANTVAANEALESCVHATALYVDELRRGVE